MNPRIKISRSDFDELSALILADLPEEVAAFALAGVATHGGNQDLIVRRIVPIPREHYEIKENYHLRVAPAAINGIAALCEANRLTAIVCHSHPNDADYSPSDDHGERRISRTLQAFLPAGAPIGSLLFSPERLRARVWAPGTEVPTTASEVVVLGRSIGRYDTLRGRPPHTQDC